MKQRFSGSFLRTIYFIIAAAALPAMAIVLLTGLERQGETARRAEAEAMGIVQAAARIQDTLAASSRTLLATMARMDVVRSRQANLPDFLERLGFSHPAYADLFVVDERGYIVASNTVQDESFRVADQSYFSGSLIKDTLIPGGVTFSRLSKVPIFHFSYGVRQDSRRSLILVTGVRLSYYAYMMTGLPLPEGASLYLADARGRLAVSLPGPEDEFGTLPPDLEDAVLAREGGEGLFYLPSARERQLVAYKRIALAENPDQPYMTAILTVPEHAVFLGLTRVQLNGLLFLLSALTGIAFLGFVFVRIVLLPPVRSMLEAAKAYASGNFTPRPNRATMVRELAELADSMSAMADAIEEQEGRLIRARDEAESAGKAKGEFLANMSHEIRTPLNAIIGMAYLALKSTLTPRQKGYLGKIHEAGGELLKIINNILELSKLDAGKLGMESISFTMRDIFADNKRHFSGVARSKGLDLRFEIDDDTPRYLVGDPLRLGQIVGHLLDSALYNTQEGSVTVSCDLESRDSKEAVVVLSVSDTSQGMNPATLAAMRQLFARGEAAPDTASQTRGTGLGLLLAHKLVQAMGGRLTLDSVPGRGTTVRLRLAFGMRSSEERLPRNTLIKGLRCLAVDDDTVSLGVLKELMDGFGIRTDAETDSRLALVALKEADKQGRPYDLMIVDWRMPEIDGVELTRQIRAEAELSRQPAIIMLSAYGWSGILLQAEEAGVDSFLHKPINESVLLDTIMTLLHPQGRSDEDDASALGEEEAAGRDLEGLQVLVVEDNAVNQQIAQEILGSAGIRVGLAGNGEKALAFFTPPPLHAPFAVVLMDLQMPVMDGFEASRRIRELDAPWAKDLPIIAMTAHNRTSEMETEAGPALSDHVSKPIDVAELFSALRRWKPPLPVRDPGLAEDMRALYRELRDGRPSSAQRLASLRPLLAEYLREGRLLRLEHMVRSGKLDQAAAFLERLNSVLEFMDEE